MTASITSQIAEALSFAFSMTWEITWALVIGFALSAAVQAVVSKDEMSVLLPDDSPHSIAIACGLGAASSSCSYAAVALARSIFRKGANFTASMAFEFASTNLVIELGIILAVLLGWQFTLAEFVGGPIMIAILRPPVPAFLKPDMVERHGSRRTGAWPASWRAMPRWTCPSRADRSCPESVRPAGSQRSATTTSWTGPRSGRTSPPAC